MFVVLSKGLYCVIRGIVSDYLGGCGVIRGVPGNWRHIPSIIKIR